MTDHIGAARMLDRRTFFPVSFARTAAIVRSRVRPAQISHFWYDSFSPHDLLKAHSSGDSWVAITNRVVWHAKCFG